MAWHSMAWLMYVCAVRNTSKRWLFESLPVCRTIYLCCIVVTRCVCMADSTIRYLCVLHWGNYVLFSDNVCVHKSRWRRREREREKSIDDHCDIPANMPVDANGASESTEILIWILCDHRNKMEFRCFSCRPFGNKINFLDSLDRIIYSQRNDNL